MAETSFQYLGAAYDAVDIAQNKWLRFADACTANYGMARIKHVRALQEAKQAVEAFENNKPSGWIFANALLTFVAPWAGKLLLPVAKMTGGKIVDKLTLDWAKDALAGPRVRALATSLKDPAGTLGEQIWDSLKGTALNGVKQHAGSTADAYEPVAPDGTDFSARLKVGIRDRGIPLMEMLKKLKETSHHLSIPVAKAIQSGFEYDCPFVTEKPADISTDDTELQRKAELEMWVDWALNQNEKWWRGQRPELGKLGPVVVNTDPRTIGHRAALQPVLNRLLRLGVPSHAVSSSVPMNGPKTPIFDMVKFIEWAQRRRAPINIPAVLEPMQYEQICRAARPGVSKSASCTK